MILRIIESMNLMSNYLDREYEDLYCGLIKNCVIGYGIKITPLENDQGLIEVDSNPIKQGHDGQELRDFMTHITLSWMDQLENIPLHNFQNDNN